jgi:UDP-N-acetylglucosamine diphosphorylase/glucosamine-1-phosphate N-acetyltransferase
MKITFDDNGLHKALAPLTLTRPVAELRLGILTIRESWLFLLGEDSSFGFKTEAYLQVKYPALEHPDLTIAGNIKPTPYLANLVSQLGSDTLLKVNGCWIATKGAGIHITEHKSGEELIIIEKVWHLFQNNAAAIKVDYACLTAGRTTQQLSSTNTVLGKGEIFVEAGAKIECTILNTDNGPIYIGKDAEIMEGSVIRGPFALGEQALVKMSAKIYGDTSIGPFCKVGGEISNSIFQAYSNKGHDGFMGNSIVGEWCNFGADTNTSNLKNNYSPVRIYSHETQQMEETEVTFCGVIMGDHSKTGINTMLNTATSVGVCANIFGSGFPPKKINSFSWGGFENSPKFKLDKAYEVAQNMMKRRKVELTEADKKILSALFNQMA